MKGFIYLLGGLVLGLGIGYLEPWYVKVLFGLGATCVLYLSYKNRHLWLYLVPLMFGIGAGVILSVLPIVSGKGEETGIVIRSSDNYFVLLSCSLRRYYVSSKGHEFQALDIVKVDGYREAFRITTYEGRFDFGNYLRLCGVRSEISKATIEGIFLLPLRLRAREKDFLAYFDVDTAALLNSLLFGHRDYDNATLESASSLNLIFILSSSGLFYGGYLRLCEYVVSRKASETKTRWICLTLGILALPLGYRKVGVWRVFLGRLIHCFPKGRKLHRLDVLGLSGLMLLALDLYRAFDTGFYVGYGLSLTLYYAGPLWKDKKRLAKKGISLLFIRLFLLPLSLSSSGAIHPFAFFFNLLLLPFASSMTALGAISFCSVPFTHVLPLWTKMIGYLIESFGKTDLALSLPLSGYPFVFGFYAVFLLALFFTEMGFASARRTLILCYVGVICMSLCPIWNGLSESVTFINVGQGDSILIQDGFTNVMIDTGGVKSFDIAEECLIPYLSKRRIRHLDALILTHQDFDHMGGRDTLVQKGYVDRLIESQDLFPFQAGDMVFENLNHYEGNGENDRSLVISLTFMGKRWLFMGDAPTLVEQKILQEHPLLDCDILKIGHHGSDTSTSASFLDAVTPEEAVISCGAKNGYGHPKASVLTLLKERGIRIRRTDLEGTITYARARGRSV